MFQKSEKSGRGGKEVLIISDNSLIKNNENHEISRPVRYAHLYLRSEI